MDVNGRLNREAEHLLNTLASQRQITSKAFEQVQVAMLEQEMSIRSHTPRNERLAEVMRELDRRLPHWKISRTRPLKVSATTVSAYRPAARSRPV